MAHEYLGAVFYHWWWAFGVIGTLVGYRLDFLRKSRGQQGHPEVPGRYTVAALVLSLAVAQFLAWKEMRTQRNAAWLETAYVGHHSAGYDIWNRVSQVPDGPSPRLSRETESWVSVVQNDLLARNEEWAVEFMGQDTSAPPEDRSALFAYLDRRLKSLDRMRKRARSESGTAP